MRQLEQSALKLKALDDQRHSKLATVAREVSEIKKQEQDLHDGQRLVKFPLINCK